MSSTIRIASPRHSSWRSSRRLWARWKLSAGTDPLGKEGWMRVGEYLGQGYVSCWRKQWNGTMTTKMVCPKFFSNSCPTPGYIRGPAVTKAADYLEQAEYNTGNPEDDLKTQSFVKQLLYHPKLIRSAPYIVAAQHDSHTTSLRRILPAHPKKSLTAIQNIQLFSSFRPPHRLRLLSTSAGAAADGTNAATGGDGKMVTATKKGAAVLDQHIPDDIKEAYHVLQVGDEIYDATLNQTNVGNNNNKFYVIQVLESDVGGSFIIYHRWGRVGVRGKDKVQAYSTRNEAIYEFKGKFQSKTNNRWSDRKSFKPYAKKYTWIETDYGETDKETDKTEKKGSITDQIKESQLETRTAQFISLICDIGMMKQQMMEIGYNADKLPLGKLSKSTVLKGYNVLKRISNVISKADRIQLEQLTGEFYTVIPHNFGFRKMSEFIIDTPQKLKAKLEMVEALDEIEIATKLLEDDSSDQDDPLYAQYKQLCCDFTPLEAYSEEYSMIKTYLMNTRGKAHSGYTVDIVQIFKVSRHGETEKFQKKTGCFCGMVLG